MNKKIIALAVAAAFAVPAMASAQTVLFGQFKYEVGYIEDVAGENNFVHSTKGTRIGIYGTEDLGGGLQGIFRFQGGLGGVNRTMSATTWSMNEENWAGLRGGFGTLQLGRSDTAMKKTGGNHFRAFTDTLAEPSLIPARTGRADGVHYTTPNISGFTGYVTVEPNGVETDTYLAGGADFRFGAFYVGAAIESSPDTGTFTAGTTDETNWQIGGKWNFGQGNVGVLYQSINDGDDDVITVPVNFKVTPQINLRAAVKYTSPDVGDSFTNWGIGAQYMLSNRTEAFVNIWADDAVGQTMSTSNDEAHFGLGLRHSF